VRGETVIPAAENLHKAGLWPGLMFHGARRADHSSYCPVHAVTIARMASRLASVIWLHSSSQLVYLSVVRLLPLHIPPRQGVRKLASVTGQSIPFSLARYSFAGIVLLYGVSAQAAT
jgi:hypothetical protein